MSENAPETGELSELLRQVRTEEAEQRLRVQQEQGLLDDWQRLEREVRRLQAQLSDGTGLLLDEQLHVAEMLGGLRTDQARQDDRLQHIERLVGEISSVIRVAAAARAGSVNGTTRPDVTALPATPSAAAAKRARRRLIRR